MRRGSLIVLAAFLLGAGPFDCGGAGSDSGGPVDPCEERKPSLDWENFGKGYMELHCVGCHSSLLPAYLRENAPVGVDFNTYEQVMQWVDRIEERATGAEPTMPPAGGPTADEIARLEEWIECRVRPDIELLEKEGG